MVCTEYTERESDPAQKKGERKKQRKGGRVQLAACPDGEREWGIGGLWTTVYVSVCVNECPCVQVCMCRTAASCMERDMWQSDAV